MSLILSGTTGVSGVDGTSATPALQGNDSNTGVSFGTDIVTINTGGQARVTTDASGNVGVGTVTPASDARLTLSSPNTESYVMFARTNSGVFDAAIGNNGGSIVFKGGVDSSTIAGLNELARIDSSGNLGLGVTPSAWAGQSAAYYVSQFGNAAFYGISTNEARMTVNAYVDSGGTNRYISNGFATRHDQKDGVYTWRIAASGTAGNAISFTQAMTLTAAGNLLVGMTTVQTGIAADPVGISLYGSTANGVGVFVRSSSDSVLYVNNKTSGGSLVTFYNGGNAVGSITSNGTTTAYNTTSDYRLKENVTPMTGALATVAQLKPCTYTWRADGSAGQGFIAHELQSVVPDCVTGTKDAVDAEGKPQYQGVDTSFLVATLVSAIQEQQAIITKLQADVAALKGAA